MNEIQKTILDIYKVVKDLFNKYDITYYAIGGTCIGAVRHQGFIPWDDDLDMSRRLDFTLPPITTVYAVLGGFLFRPLSFCHQTPDFVTNLG